MVDCNQKNSVSCYGCWIRDLTMRSPKIDVEMECFATVFGSGSFGDSWGMPHNGIGLLGDW